MNQGETSEVYSAYTCIPYTSKILDAHLYVSKKKPFVKCGHSFPINDTTLPVSQFRFKSSGFVPIAASGLHR